MIDSVNELTATQCMLGVGGASGIITAASVY